MSRAQVTASMMARGRAVQALDEAWAQVLQNIADQGTDPTKLRKLQLHVDTRPSEDRDLANVKIYTKLSLPGKRATEVVLRLKANRQGELFALEAEGELEGETEQ